MNIQNLDLNLLVALDALVRERNVTRAGRALSLSQPAMSSALARLRSALGDPLLVRAPGGMQATPRALEIIGPIRQALGLVEGALASQAAFDPAAARDVFRVAGTDHAAFVLLPQLAQALHEEAPGVTLDFTPWRGAATQRELVAGEIDMLLGVGALESVPSGLYRKRILGDHFVCLVRRGHPRLRGRLTLARYLELPHILVSPRGGRTGLMDEALAKLGKSRRVAFVVPSFLAAPVIVAQSDYIVTMPACVAEPFAEYLPIEVHPTPLQIEGGEWYCLWHERTHKDPAHRWLRQKILSLAARAEQRGADDLRRSAASLSRSPRRRRP